MRDFLLRGVAASAAKSAFLGGLFRQGKSPVPLSAAVRAWLGNWFGDEAAWGFGFALLREWPTLGAMRPRRRWGTRLVGDRLAEWANAESSRGGA
jgi:hypothetical protein